jgi:hypothetical protein
MVTCHKCGVLLMLCIGCILMGCETQGWLVEIQYSNQLVSMQLVPQPVNDPYAHVNVAYLVELRQDENGVKFSSEIEVPDSLKGDMREWHSLYAKLGRIDVLDRLNGLPVSARRDLYRLMKVESVNKANVPEYDRIRYEVIGDMARSDLESQLVTAFRGMTDSERQHSTRAVVIPVLCSSTLWVFVIGWDGVSVHTFVSARYYYVRMNERHRRSSGDRLAALSKFSLLDRLLWTVMGEQGVSVDLSSNEVEALQVWHSFPIGLNR